MSLQDPPPAKYLRRGEKSEDKSEWRPVDFLRARRGSLFREIGEFRRDAASWTCQAKTKTKTVSITQMEEEFERSRDKAVRLGELLHITKGSRGVEGKV